MQNEHNEVQMPTTPAPASTVILVRESPEQAGRLETLLLLRNQGIAFGGTWVFPGGRVEPRDFQGEGPVQGESQVNRYPQIKGEACCKQQVAEHAFQAAIHAATRETYEEAGLVLSPDALFSIAHWTTPARFERRFATWFFLCPIREAVTVRVDQREILDYQWLTPNKALAEHDAGGLALTQPTRHTLETLRQFNNLETLCRELEARTIHIYPDNCDQFRPVRLRRLQ